MHKDIEKNIVRLNEQLSRVRPDDTFSKMLLTGKIKEQYRLLSIYDITEKEL